MALKVINKELIDLINEPIDPSLIRKNYSGEKYITGYTVVRLLNRATNGAWDFKIDKKWVETVDDKGKKKDIYHMDITLRCLFDDGLGHTIELSKTGTAGKVLEAGAKNASNIYKSLETLALRKAASYFGIGAELWLNDDEKDYFEQDVSVDLWTDEDIKQHEEELSFIEKIQKENEFSDEEMNNIVTLWNPSVKSIYEISPDKIQTFVDYLKKQIEDVA